MTNTRIAGIAFIAMTTTLAVTLPEGTAVAQNQAFEFNAAANDPGRRDHKNPAAAFALSMVGSAVGYGALFLSPSLESERLFTLGLVGVTVGPSLGHMYTGQHGRAWLAAGARGLGLAAVAVGALSNLCFGGADGGCQSDPHGKSLLLGGAALTVGGTLYSLVDSGLSARRVNREKRRSLALTPAPVMGPDRSMGMGMAVSGSF